MLIVTDAEYHISAYYAECRGAEHLAHVHWKVIYLVLEQLKKLASQPYQKNGDFKLLRA